MKASNSASDDIGRKSSGFTLVEMLCTIALVAILVAMLFPAYSAIMAKTKQARCASQLRQVHQVIALYANDHDQYYPPTYGSLVDPSATWWWYQDTSPLADYIGADSWSAITICPLNRTAQVITSNSHVKGYAYVVNYNVMATTGNSYKLRKLTYIPLPSSIILMADSVANSTWGWGFDNTDPANPTYGGFPRMCNTHQGKANILWCDGHVTSQNLNTLAPKNSMNINLKY